MDNLDEFFASNLPDESQEDEVQTDEIIETVEEVIEPETEMVEEEVAEEVETAKEVDRTGWAPVSALTAERDKARLAKEETEALRRQIADFENQQRQSQVTPDPYDDPNGYSAHIQDVIQQQVAQTVALQNLTHSRTRAIEKHGQEEIDAVAEWATQVAATDPTFESKVFAASDPVEWIIAEKKRSETLKDFSADMDAYVLKRAAELGLAAISQPEVSAQTTTARKPPGPASLNHAKSRDVAVNITTGKDAFDATFNK